MARQHDVKHLKLKCEQNISDHKCITDGLRWQRETLNIKSQIEGVMKRHHQKKEFSRYD